MSKLLIVTCTKAKTDKEFEDRPIFKSFKKQYESNSNIEPFIFKNNTRGLSQCYNEILNDDKNADKTALFVHDDVELEDIFLYEKLISSPYSVTGLAGAKSFNKKSQHLAWHICANNDTVGEVCHMSKDKQVFTTKFGPTNSRSLVLDGLFLSCKIKDLQQKNVSFDENFTFHHYDISFCLRANQQKISCGVLPIRVVHHGLGDSMLTQEWTEANAKFKQLYC